MEHRAPEAIAREIERLTTPAQRRFAQPYLDAMKRMNNWVEPYYNDRATSVAAYLVGNLGAFKGDDARRIKAELKAIAGL